MSKARIFYVEDESSLAAIVRDTLTLNGYEVIHFDNGKAALNALDAHTVDIYLLDVMLPDTDGFTIGKALRNQQNHQPIIYLTAKNQTADVLEGFKSGGNDYIRKPFSIEELMARIDNLLSYANTSDSPESIFEFKDLIFNFKRLELAYKEVMIELTFREAEIIQYMLSNKDHIIEKKHLLCTLWGDDTYYNSRSLDVYIRKIRLYFEQTQVFEIKTLRGVGYRLIEKSQA